MKLARLTGVTSALIYVQILLGATMRHRDAGLAIPDFPLAFGRVWPPVWSIDIAVHFAHRVGAVVVTAAIVATVVHVCRRHWSNPLLKNPALLMVFLVVVQVTLGALVVLSGLQPIVNTAHVVNGALLLATSVVLTLRSRWTPLTAAMARRGTGHAVPHQALGAHS